MTVPDTPVVLLTGPGAARLERAALEAAARLLCRRGGDPADPDCPDCRRTLRREHPDLVVAAPEKRRRSNVPAFEEAESKETMIPTALVRAIAADSTRLPYEAPRRAVLLLDVDCTEPAASSALLKILEEPPKKTRFLLTATRAPRLPATILSRVVVYPLPGPSREQTAGILAKRGLAPEEAQARAAFSPSDPEEAADLDLQAARDERDGLLEALSGVFLGGSVSWALSLAGLIAADGAAEAVNRLNLAALLLRDSVAAATDPAGQAVVHRERFADLLRLGRAGARRLLDAAMAALDLASSLADSNRNPRLAAEAFALGLVEARGGADT